MRVVHVSEVTSGGVRELLANYAEDQVARGFDVHVIGDETLSELPGTHHLWRGSRRRPESAIRDLSRLNRILRDLGPDVIHLHSFFAGLFGRLHSRRKPGFPIVYQPHGWAFDALDAAAARFAVASFERWASRRTDLLVTNCEDEIEEAHAEGIEIPAVALGMPIDLEWFIPGVATEREALRTRLGVDDRAALVCIGRIVRQKGYDILVREWERQPIPDAVLYLVGAGKTDRLAAMAPTEWARTIHAVGETDDPRAWLQAADLMLLPSRYEGQAIAVSEAMACGLPVVAFAVNGARAAIVDGGDPAGAVVARGDAETLLAEARRRIDDPLLLKSEATVARTRAERDNVAGTVFDRLVKAYESAIEAHGTRSGAK
ncbi:MAG: hypothetical protein QOI06_977 [Nocardioidaceae bacterium]|nr:hypothetical protein [Nocardioidaceae bacterium]